MRVRIAVTINEDGVWHYKPLVEKEVFVEAPSDVLRSIDWGAVVSPLLPPAISEAEEALAEQEAQPDDQT